MSRQGYDAARRGGWITYDGSIVADVAKAGAQRHPRLRSAYRPTTFSKAVRGHAENGRRRCHRGALRRNAVGRSEHLADPRARHKGV